MSARESQVFPGRRGNGERLVNNHVLLTCYRCVGRVRYDGILQSDTGLADSAVGVAGLAFALVVTIVVDPFGGGLDIADQALLGLGVEDQAQHGEIICTDSYHGTTSEGVIKWNVVLIDEPPRDRGESIDVDYIGGVDEGAEEAPYRMEMIMEGFWHDRRLGLIEFRQVEQDLSLSRVGHGRLFKENMFACAERPTQTAARLAVGPEQSQCLGR